MLLTNKTLARMKQVGEEYHGKPYDLYFGWSDARIYCSELVWKIYKYAADIEIGQLAKLSSFDLEHPLVQQKLKERYGNNIPFDEWVISPAAMFNSEQLMTVVSR